MPADGDGEWGATENYLVVLPICAEFLSEWLIENDWQLLRRRVAEHCSRIEDDFYTGRSWFFGGPNGGVPEGNQFTQVIGGLGVGALALLGHDPRACRWLELAVTQMLRSMDATGTDGSYFEGSSYGLGTMEQVTMMAHLLERTGDRRLIEHPQVRNFSYWHMDTMLNDYDHWLPLNDGGGSLSHEALFNRMRNWAGRVMALAAARTRDPVLNWYLHEVVGDPSHDVFGLLYYASGFPQKRPKAQKALRRMRPSSGWIHSLPAGTSIPLGDETNASGADRLAVHYPMQGIVVVRTGFAREDMLLVLRGGWHSPGHDHLDRNSVLFYDGTVPVIAEAGPGPYNDPDFDRHFGAYHAHSTLQLDGNMPGHHEKRYMCAHEGVERLADGTVRMIGEAAGSYNTLARCRRIIDARLPDCITIADEVVPSDAKEHEAAFWFHTPQAARLEDGHVVIPGQKGFWLLTIGQGNLKWTREQLGGEGSENRATFSARGTLPQQGANYVFTIVHDSRQP
ncbi:MAG: heparinase II/III family protein [Candidatus Latescibacterota bacterium]